MFVLPHIELMQVVWVRIWLATFHDSVSKSFSVFTWFLLTDRWHIAQTYGRDIIGLWLFKMFYLSVYYISIMVCSHLPLFGQILQAISSHLNKNLLKVHMNSAHWPTESSLVWKWLLCETFFMHRYTAIDNWPFFPANNYRVWLFLHTGH